MDLASRSQNANQVTKKLRSAKRLVIAPLPLLTGKSLIIRPGLQLASRRRPPTLAGASIREMGKREGVEKKYIYTKYKI